MALLARHPIPNHVSDFDIRQLFENLRYSIELWLDNLLCKVEPQEFERRYKQWLNLHLAAPQLLLEHEEPDRTGEILHMVSRHEDASNIGGYEHSRYFILSFIIMHHLLNIFRLRYPVGMHEEHFRTMNHVEEGMSKIYLPAEVGLEKREKWRWETIRALTAHPLFKRTQIKTAEGTISAIREDMEHFLPDNAFEDLRVLFNEDIIQPAIELQNMMTTSANEYEFQEIRLLSANDWEQYPRGIYRSMDICTGQLVRRKPLDSRPICRLYPSICRIVPHNERKIEIVEPVFVDRGEQVPKRSKTPTLEPVLPFILLLHSQTILADIRAIHPNGTIQELPENGEVRNDISGSLLETKVIVPKR
ncbi:hypothetical protein CC78DRAFT_584881 [Lojkania enalia]|uniref:Uncharacterized protein n=1 Tax=Lojkania enalia TaxID=147567 RepID=A0A9P4K2T2_9PLEO|nr:hypothetical protein CC78DRAFT_584881 [Didymosphaeria enalia]